MFRKPVPIGAHCTIRDAWMELNDAVSPAHGRQFCTTTLENVYQEVSAIQQHIAARHSLRNLRMLRPLFNGLHHYAKSSEVLYNGTPYMPWIWSPMLVILNVASKYGDVFDKIIRHYSRMGECLLAFEKYNETTFLHVEFPNILALFYADILAFHKEVYLVLLHTNVQTEESESWEQLRRRLNHITDDLDTYKKRLFDPTTTAGTIDDFFEARRIRAEALRHHTEGLERTSNDETRQVVTQFQRTVNDWLEINGQMSLLKTTDYAHSDRHQYSIERCLGTSEHDADEYAPSDIRGPLSNISQHEEGLATHLRWRVASMIGSSQGSDGAGVSRPAKSRVSDSYDARSRQKYSE